MENKDLLILHVCPRSEVPIPARGKRVPVADPGKRCRRKRLLFNLSRGKEHACGYAIELADVLDATLIEYQTSIFSLPGVEIFERPQVRHLQTLAGIGHELTPPDVGPAGTTTDCMPTARPPAGLPASRPVKTRAATLMQASGVVYAANCSCAEATKTL